MTNWHASEVDGTGRDEESPFNRLAHPCPAPGCHYRQAEGQGKYEDFAPSVESADLYCRPEANSLWVRKPTLGLASGGQYDAAEKRKNGANI
jgi:hypothetical protein